MFGTLRKQADADAWAQEAPGKFTPLFMDTAIPDQVTLAAQ